MEEVKKAFDNAAVEHGGCLVLAAPGGAGLHVFLESAGVGAALDHVEQVYETLAWQRDQRCQGVVKEAWKFENPRTVSLRSHGRPAYAVAHFADFCACAPAHTLDPPVHL